MKDNYQAGFKHGESDVQNDVFNIPENAGASYRAGYIDGATKRERQKAVAVQAFRERRRIKRNFSVQYS